jgi:hypothetical protein
MGLGFKVEVLGFRAGECCQGLGGGRGREVCPGRPMENSMCDLNLRVWRICARPHIGLEGYLTDKKTHPPGSLPQAYT